MHTVENAHDDRINAVTTCYGFLVTAASDQSLKVWNPSEHFKFVMETAHHTAQVNALLSHDDFLYTCSHDKTIKVTPCAYPAQHCGERGRGSSFVSAGVCLCCRSTTRERAGHWRRRGRATRTGSRAWR
jgi:WD40 repeat protein